MTTATSLSLRFLFTKIHSSALNNVFAKPAFFSTLVLIKNLNSSANFLQIKRPVVTTAALNLHKKLKIKHNKMSSAQYHTIETGAPNSTNYSIYFSKYWEKNVKFIWKKVNCSKVTLTVNIHCCKSMYELLSGILFDL